METKDLLKSRISAYKEAVKYEVEPKNIILQASVFNWRYLDAGCNLNDALTDYDVMYDANVRFLKKYTHDAYIELGWRNPLRVTRSVGNNTWIINEAGDELSIKDNVFMEDNEYDELIAGPMKFFWEKVIPRKSTYLQRTDCKKYLDAGVEAHKEFGAYLKRISKTASENFGVAGYTSTYETVLGSYNPGHELIFNVLRGMKNSAIDMRKQPDKLKDAVESIEHEFMDPIFDTLYTHQNGTDPNSYVDQQQVMLSHSILNPKQFGTYYWPYLQKLARYAEEKDKLIFVFLESDTERFWDYFAELPKGHFVFALELDNLGKMKKALPNIALIGGMPTFLMGNGTPEQCIDKCKECLDLYAPGGGYLMSFDKTFAFKNDAKPENLEAVCNFMAKQW